ncbi:MAG: hypothetical protein J3Q66DRAFT_404643 [Benniella sp.]|nr:MAG: hypothetical protein J3Q66DRAFT_404643 [Benniella sp.]
MEQAIHLEQFGLEAGLDAMSVLIQLYDDSHQNCVNGAYSPRGDQVASGHYGIVRLWNVEGVCRNLVQDRLHALNHGRVINGISVRNRIAFRGGYFLSLSVANLLPRWSIYNNQMQLEPASVAGRQIQVLHSQRQLRDAVNLQNLLAGLATIGTMDPVITKSGMNDGEDADDTSQAPEIRWSSNWKEN